MNTTSGPQHFGNISMMVSERKEVIIINMTSRDLVPVADVAGGTEAGNWWKEAPHRGVSTHRRSAGNHNRRLKGPATGRILSPVGDASSTEMGRRRGVISRALPLSRASKHCRPEAGRKAAIPGREGSRSGYLMQHACGEERATPALPAASAVVRRGRPTYRVT